MTWHDSMVAKHGSEEAVQQYMQEIAAKGGKVKNKKKGFGTRQDLAKKHGAINGKYERKKK